MTVDRDELRDRMEIVDLMDRYLRSLDEDETYDEDWARAYVTEDVRSEVPVGEAVGWREVARQTEAALAQFERTHHVGANHVVDLDGDRAAVRCNAVMTHLHPAALRERLGERFTVGGVVEGEVVRTAAGWRLARVAIRPVWFDGQPPLRPGGVAPDGGGVPVTPPRG
ncbi:nuclear transport factor 2 family protein [Streptomyces sp. 4N509B]|uniref:nuclear transport factor 2 family protein n=1 Tax=Streptomyces sp. 4N509B TaxID=3457413 RepID=UPI003FD441E0